MSGGPEDVTTAAGFMQSPTWKLERAMRSEPPLGGAPIAPPEILSPPDLSDYLGITENTLAHWRYLGKGPAFAKVGKHVRYRRSDVDAWLDAQVRRSSE